MPEDYPQLDPKAVPIPYTVGDREMLVEVSGDVKRLAEGMNDWRHDVEARLGPLADEKRERDASRAKVDKWRAFVMSAIVALVGSMGAVWYWLLSHRPFGQ